MTTTTLYKIKTHEEEFTDLEIKLRREIEAVLPENERHYASDDALESLKNYRKENRGGSFIPENHYYAFLDDKLVGFIHHWPIDDKTTNMSIPFAKDNNTDIEKAILKQFKSDILNKGFTTVQLSANYLNSMARKWGENNGFEAKEIAMLSTTIIPSNFTLESKNAYEVRPYTKEDAEDVMELYLAQGYTRERMNNQFEYMHDNVFGTDRVVAWNVALKDGKVVGHTICEKFNNETNSGYMNAVTNNVEDSDKQGLISEIYSYSLKAAREMKISSLNFSLLPQIIDQRKYYEKNGFEFKEIYAFKKQLK